MHFLFIAEFFPNLKHPVFSGGVEARCYYVITKIAKKHTVTVLSRRKNGEDRYEQDGNLTIKRYGQEINDYSATLSSIIDRLGYIFWCIRESKNIAANIVEGSNYITFLPAFTIGLIKRIPKIAYYPDVLIGKWISQFGLVLGLIGEIAERSFVLLPWNHIITTSPPPKERLVNAGVKTEKISFIRLGVSLEDWQKTRETIKHKKEQLVVVSRLVSYKRVDWAIKLLSRLHPEFPELTLTVIGSGPEGTNLKTLVETLHLQNNVTFLAHVTDEKVRQEVVISLLLLHPSLIEGYGIVLVEAAAAGTPFVAADIPTSLDLAAEFKCGLTFKQENFDDFVQLVGKLLHNKKEIDMLREAGFKQVKDYDWQKVADGVVELYSGIVNDNRTLVKPKSR